MVTAYIGLGSNLADRRGNLEKAASLLSAITPSLRASPVFETRALVPTGAPADWDRPYLNAALSIQWRGTAAELLAALKKIETDMGRVPAERWAPRIIDLDILLFGQEEVSSLGLQVPHVGIGERAFVLAPLKFLSPGLRLPLQAASMLARARVLKEKQVLWMGILNVTPDSFSDGGIHLETSGALARARLMDEAGTQWLDVGAESTRPKAEPVSPAEEWARLEPILCALRGDRRFFRPWISVDTFHGATAVRALEAGAKVINDVSGGQDPLLLEAVASAGCDYVFMHNQGLPADPSRTLPPGDPVHAVLDWAMERLESFGKSGISPDRLIFDPGIGFGKTASQSWEILRRSDELLALPVRLLVGHSRKSFLTRIGSTNAKDRDPETLALSLRLAKAGVDILRVHEPEAHHRAWRAYQELP